MKRIPYIIILAFTWYGCQGNEDNVMLKDEDGGNDAPVSLRDLANLGLLQYPINADGRPLRGWFDPPLIQDNWKTPGLREKVEKILHESIVFTHLKKAGLFLEWVGHGETAVEILMSMLRYEILPQRIDKVTIRNIIWNIIEDRERRGNPHYNPSAGLVRPAVVIRGVRPVQRPVVIYKIDIPPSSTVSVEHADGNQEEQNGSGDHTRRLTNEQDIQRDRK